MSKSALTFRGKVTKVNHNFRAPKEPSYVGQRVEQKPSTMEITLVVDQPVLPPEPVKPYNLRNKRPADPKPFVEPTLQQPKRTAKDTDETYAAKVEKAKATHEKKVAKARREHEYVFDQEKSRQEQWDAGMQEYEAEVAEHKRAVAALGDAVRHYAMIAGTLPLLQGVQLGVALSTDARATGMLPGLLEGLLPAETSASK